mmetsp:Transcript_49621/g.91584  ORF Transcript_49621/g.91584 Transcript_49621/m.91584 type:complete len:214 (+) Transcript_49621:42-683(+)
MAYKPNTEESSGTSSGSRKWHMCLTSGEPVSCRRPISQPCIAVTLPMPSAHLPYACKSNAARFEVSTGDFTGFCVSPSPRKFITRTPKSWQESCAAFICSRRTDPNLTSVRPVKRTPDSPASSPDVERVCELSSLLVSGSSFPKVLARSSCPKEPEQPLTLPSTGARVSALGFSASSPTIVSVAANLQLPLTLSKPTLSGSLMSVLASCNTVR